MKSVTIPQGFFAFTFFEQECVRFGESFATILDFYEKRGECLILLYTEFRADQHDNGLREVPLSALNKQY